MSVTHLADDERVARLKGDELVEVEEDVEEIARQLAPLEVRQVEARLVRRLHHIVQLAQNVFEQHGFLPCHAHPSHGTPLRTVCAARQKRTQPQA